MDNRKNLLEELRKLTPNFKFNEMDERDTSVKDIISPEDSYEDDEDEEDSYEKDRLEDDDSDEYEEEGEEGEDIDGDGEADDLHAINILKNAYNSSEEEVKNSIVSLARLIVDNDIDIESIEQFLDEVDIDHDEDDEDEFGDAEDNFEDEDEFGDGEGMEDEESEEPEAEENESFMEEYGDSMGKISFMNEGVIFDEFDSLDMGDMLS